MIKKTLGNIFTILVVSTFLFSCQSDEFSMNTDYKSGLCSVRAGQSMFLLSDDGLTLNPVSSDDLKGFIDGERVLVTYNVVSEGDNNFKGSFKIKIYDIQSVPILEVVDRNELALNINDPVWLLSKPWIGGGFINIEFSFGHSNLNIKHDIFMVYDGSETVNGKNFIYLTFGHNAKSDPSTTTSPAFTSVRIGSIKEVEKADSLIVSVFEGLRMAYYHLSLK